VKGLDFFGLFDLYLFLKTCTIGAGSLGESRPFSR